MGWGIAETASEIEKIKSKSADYLNGLNSCGVIDWNTYNYAFDFYMDLLMEAYRQGQKDIQSEPDPEWKRKHYEASYAQGFVDGCKLYERQSDFDITEKIDKAYNNGYEQGYLQGKIDYEQKNGRWVDTGSGQECSICHEIQYGYDNYRHFCPNCGAKMSTPNNAHWIKQPNGEYKCSVCGDTTLVPLYECHTCGAKMVTE